MKTIDALYKGEISNGVFVDYGFCNTKNKEDLDRMYKLYKSMFMYIIPFTYFSKKYDIDKAKKLCFIVDKKAEDKEFDTETKDTKEKFHKACIKNKLVELIDSEIKVYEQYKKTLSEFMSLNDIDEYIEWYKQNKSLFRNVY